MMMGCETVGGMIKRESWAQGDVHFKHSDKISDERHAAAPRAVLVFLQMRGSQMEAAAKRKDEGSVLD
jgi:hypothetical protein